MAQTTEAELVRTLRAIQRLQTQARKLKRQLKKNQQDLRHERKMLRGLQTSLAQRDPAVAPMRLMAGVVGIKVAKQPTVERGPVEELFPDEKKP